MKSGMRVGVILREERNGGAKMRCRGERRTNAVVRSCASSERSWYAREMRSLDLNLIISPQILWIEMRGHTLLFDLRV